MPAGSDLLDRETVEDTVERVEPYSHQHDDGTWQPGRGLPLTSGDWTGPWDCDPCRDHYLESRANSRSKKYGDKNIGVSVSALKLERQREHGGVEDNSIAQARMLDEAGERFREANPDPPPAKGKSLEESYKAAKQKMEHRQNLTG